jgi:hypothetical protein
MLKQIICTIKIRRAPKRHDNIDFQPIITRTAEIRPLSIAVCDKGYDSEKNQCTRKRRSESIQHHSCNIHTFRFGGRMVGTGNR